MIKRVSMLFFETFVQKQTTFFQEIQKENWWKKIKKSNVKKRSLSVKHGTNKEWGRLKEEKSKRWNTEEGGVQKTKTEFHQQKLTTEKFEYFGQKTDTEMKKNMVKKKCEKKNEIKNKRERRKVRSNKKKMHKKRRWRKKQQGNMRWRKKERIEKGKKRKRREKQKGMNKRMKGKSEQRKSDDRKKGKMLKENKWIKKGTEQKQKMNIFGIICSGF